MLTPEQINNLKQGEPVIVRGQFKAVDADGAVWIEVGNCHRWYALSCVSLPSEQPKHDPTRLFKKGDKVRIVDWQGKKPGFLNDDGTREAVVSDPEDTSGTVELKYCGRYPTVAICFLELITPVEELEPYIMLENVPSHSIEVRDKITNKVEATFYFGKDHAYTFEQAATRAEAERDSLNAEWRKNQNND